MSKQKLKPCPFCGGDVRLIRAPLGTNVIICDRCGLDAMFFGCEKNQNKIREAWNRRTTDEDPG